MNIWRKGAMDRPPERLQQLPASYTIDLDHPTYGVAFRWYLLFTHAADLIEKGHVEKR